mgnify:CR=1 FL=1
MASKIVANLTPSSFAIATIDMDSLGLPWVDIEIAMVA